jgi:hypothetical protein
MKLTHFRAKRSGNGGLLTLPPIALRFDLSPDQLRSLSVCGPLVIGSAIGFSRRSLDDEIRSAILFYFCTRAVNPLGLHESAVGREPEMYTLLVVNLKQWHDFYALIGTASATLVGLIFIADSIGAGVFTREHQVGIRSFLSPTVVHFSSVLIICLLATVPTENWSLLGVFLTVVGLIGLSYSAWIWRRMTKHGLTASIDVADRLWYAFWPIAGYLLVAISGAGLELHALRGLDVLAIALILLLLTGIRNAWDMTIWIIDRHRS